jgi:hypothetical protein
MSGDKIERLLISGDFFGNEPIGRLEDVLCGAQKSEITERLENLTVDRYISGMTDIEFKEFLCETFRF